MFDIVKSVAHHAPAEWVILFFIVCLVLACLPMRHHEAPVVYRVHHPFFGTGIITMDGPGPCCVVRFNGEHVDRSVDRQSLKIIAVGDKKS